MLLCLVHCIDRTAKLNMSQYYDYSNRHENNCVEMGECSCCLHTPSFSSTTNITLRETKNNLQLFTSLRISGHILFLLNNCVSIIFNFLILCIFLQRQYTNSANYISTLNKRELEQLSAHSHAHIYTWHLHTFINPGSDILLTVKGNYN